jgi:uncharacterized protein (TIGR02466 family)
MQDAPISVTNETPWSTSLFTVENPIHKNIKEPIKSFIHAYEKQHEFGVASEVAAEIKLGLFESKLDFFEHSDSAINTLKNFCATSVMEVVKHVNAGSWPREGNFSLEFNESWFHITRHGGYHDYHNHPNCSWCGIYYLDIGDATVENGCNCFFDPRPAAHNYTDYGTAYLEAMARVDIPPRDGVLVIFPSYLYHAAIPYNGERDRIVIAFNASIHYDP